ncbi:hypothetical protein ACQW02_20025 [Humitalea sp. 24SJ18S-53]|uniref:hypothetical protein n=1 Tax=Humitalea sp. 24SJ18S-53 TaxID=3422307 RepID=UPI003D679CBE
MTMKKALPLFVIASAGVLGWFVPIANLKGMAAEVIAAFSVLGAFLIQLMFLLATVFNPGSLPSEQIALVARELRQQQQRAITLFIAYVVVIALFVTIKAIEWPANNDGAWHIGAQILSVLSGIGLGYCGVGTSNFLVALRSIQSLRHDLLIKDAKYREDQERARAMEKVAYVSPAAGSSSYGRRQDALPSMRTTPPSSPHV